MQYALLGLAAAYRATGRERYLAGFEAGIRWLAGREDMSDSQWRGSWYYLYEANPPYAPIPTSPGVGIEDVRGVDSTSAYFAYLLWVDAQLTGTNTLAKEFADQAIAGLDFVLRKNWNGVNSSYSSWQLSDGHWELWPYRYTADQADVYLGMFSGAALYPELSSGYKSIADRILDGLKSDFFDFENGRYAEGIDGATLDWSNSPNALFPQGYVPWVVGGADETNVSAYRWLLAAQQPDGRVSAYPGDPGYVLSASVLLMAAAATQSPKPAATIDWLMNKAFDVNVGAFHDTGSFTSPAYSNIAGFALLALTGQRALFWNSD